MIKSRKIFEEVYDMLDFSWENLNMIFDITDDGRAALKHFSYKDCAEVENLSDEAI